MRRQAYKSAPNNEVNTDKNTPMADKAVHQTPSRQRGWESANIYLYRNKQLFAGSPVVTHLAQHTRSRHDAGMKTNQKKDQKKAAAGRAGGLIGGRIGGKSTSEAKKAASRANGAAGGGRPKGIPITAEHAKKAAAARAASLTPERRREIALKAVAAREAKRKISSP